MVSTAKQGQFYSNTQNSSGKGSRDGWKILQSKKAHPTPTKDSRTVTPGTLPVEFLSFTISCPWQLTPQFWEKQTLSTVTLMSPNDVHEPSLPSLLDRPVLGFICHSDFAEDTPAAAQHRPRNNPPVCVLHHILDKEAAPTHAKRYWPYHWFFHLFLKLFFKRFGLSKAKISHKSLVAAFSARARGEQISKYF